MRNRWHLRQREGQSLVEFAMTLPVLLLMFVGLIEVGAALRNYLVIVNANREGTRFAARGRWFDSESDIQDIFRRTIAAGGCLSQHCTAEDYVTIMRTVSKGEWPANTAIAITFIEVPDQVDDTMSQMVYEEPIIHGPWISGTLPGDAQPIKADARAAQAQADNFAFNQKYFLQEHLIDIPAEDNLVIFEIWFNHEQLLKLPIFTAILPERFVLYARSEMRVTLDSRIQ